MRFTVPETFSTSGPRPPVGSLEATMYDLCTIDGATFVT